MVKERIVFHIGGYEDLAPERAYRRFSREVARFARTWSVGVMVSEPRYEKDEAVWEVSTSGADWAVRTHFHFVRWDDLISASLKEPAWRWAPLGLLAFAYFLRHGALQGYLRTNWRYALFFLYPLIVFAILGLASVAAAVAAWKYGGSLVLGVLAGIAAEALLLNLAARYLFLHHLFADWIFAARYIHHGDPALAARLDVTTERFLAAASQSADEIVVIGHSLGAVLAIDLFERLLRKGVDFRKLRARVVFLSIGSSILKIGLHRRASKFRAAARAVGESANVFWADFQARIDIMNFFRTEPLVAMGFPATGRPIVRHVSIRRMLDADAYRRIRRSFFRIHRQFISGNDRRNAYDYNMLVCGPFWAETLAKAPDGAADLLDMKGGLCSNDSPRGSGGSGT